MAKENVLTNQEKDTVIKALKLLQGSLEGLSKRATAMGEVKAADQVAITQSSIEALKNKFL